MKVFCDGMIFDDIANFKDLASSIESDFIRVDILMNNLRSLNFNDMVGLEGILTDVVKTGMDTAKGASKLGKSGYKALNRKANESKNRWKVYYKPLLLKTIKEIANVLQTIYFKFTKLGKRYKELGKKIKFILDHKIQQVGKLPGGSKIFLHNFEVYVLKGYITVMENFDEFYASILDQLAENYKTPKEVSSLIKSKNTKSIEESSAGVTNAISESNKYGEISIPWVIAKHNRYYSFFKSIISNKPSKGNLNQSTSDFVKGAILAKEVTHTFEVNDRNKFIKIAQTYLSVMSSILNNNVLEDALNEGGKSIKESTDKLFGELEEVSKAIESIKPKVEAKNDEEDNREGELPDEYKALAQTVDGYIQNTSNLIAKSATAYTGIVRGTLAAVFTLVSESEALIDIIESSAGSGKDIDTGENDG